MGIFIDLVSTDDEMEIEETVATRVNNGNGDGKNTGTAIKQVIQKKQEIELIEISSDDEEQSNQQQDGNNSKHTDQAQDDSLIKHDLPQPTEELQTNQDLNGDNTPDIIDLSVNDFLLVNENKPAEDPDVFVSQNLIHVLRSHQLEGIRFMYDNVVGSLKDFDPENGLGCILAHSMGLGKTIQTIALVEIFLRVTTCKSVLIICPANVIQHWQQEFNKWLPGKNGIGDFPVFLFGDLIKTQDERLELIKDWQEQGGVLLLGYEMFRLLPTKKPKKKISKAKKTSDANSTSKVNKKKTRKVNEKKNVNSMTNEEAAELFYQAFVNPGPDLVVCDEGHRIKNFSTQIVTALFAIRTRRRIVLTGYPLQNNLMEYYCMVNFVRPGFLGSKEHFTLLFDNPIKNGMCIDSASNDIKQAKHRSYILTNMLHGFVQRRTSYLLKESLPESLEYVLLLQKTPIQKELYKKFVDFVKTEVINGESKHCGNPLKAYAACSRIFNHPDMLYIAWESHRFIPSDHSEPEDFGNEAEQVFDTSDAHQNRNFLSNTQASAQFSFTSQQSHQSASLGIVQRHPALSFQHEPIVWQSGHDLRSPNNATASNFKATSVKQKRKKRGKANSEQAKVGKKKKKKELLQLIKDDDDGDEPLQYNWIDDIFKDYAQGVIDNSYKMSIALSIIEETVRRGEKILLFSASRITLSLIEEFLEQHGSIHLPNELVEWKKGLTYLRIDGSVHGIDREEMISQFDSDPNIRLFLITTKAGSLGINLVSASRVIIFDASWNPCHDAQAGSRIYRYGQNKKTYIYRLVMHNCMEKTIFSRQIFKHCLQQRIIDEELVDANVSKKDLEHLIAYDEFLDIEQNEVDTSDWEIKDDLLRDVALSNPEMFVECPFLHNSLLSESGDQLSDEEKIQAQISYDGEKDAILNGTFVAPTSKSSNQMNPLASIESTYNNLSLCAQQQERSAVQSLSSNPPKPSKTKLRPISKTQAIENRKIIVDEPLTLNSIDTIGLKIRIEKGDTVSLIRNANGGIYLRNSKGQLMDASNTKYTQHNPLPHPDDIIEID